MNNIGRILWNLPVSLRKLLRKKIIPKNLSTKNSLANLMKFV